VCCADLGVIASATSTTVIIDCPPVLINGVWYPWWYINRNRSWLKRWINKTDWRPGTNVIFSSGLCCFVLLRHLQDGGVEPVFCHSTLVVFWQLPNVSCYAWFAVRDAGRSASRVMSALWQGVRCTV
jgi:hypothetical protein